MTSSKPRLVALAFAALWLLSGCISSVSAQLPINIRVSPPEIRYPEEVSIAVSPANPNLIAIGANIHYLFRSNDGGVQWKTDTMTSKYGVWGDPALTFDDATQLYYMHLAGNKWADSATWLRAMVLQAATPDGKLWAFDTAVIASPTKMQDKPTLKNAGYHYNGKNVERMLAAWTQFDRYNSTFPLDSSRILLAQGFGAHWSTPVRIDDHGGSCLDDDETNEGAVPVGGPHGEIYVVWARDGKLFFDRSLQVTADGNAMQFGTDKVIATMPGGWEFDIPGLSRANGFPTMTCDTSTGRLNVVWSDQHTGYTAIYSIYSDDGGTTWSAPAPIVQDSAPIHRFFPCLALDRFTHNLAVVYYAFDDTSNTHLNVYLAQSTDGGEHWHAQQVSDNVFTLNPHLFFGDYISVAASRGKVYPTWMRTDSTELSVWTAIVPELGTEDVPRHTESNDKLWIIGEQSKPAAIGLRLASPATIRLTAFDELGQQLQVLLHGQYSSGEYHLPIFHYNGTVMLRLELQRGTDSNSLIMKYNP